MKKYLVLLMLCGVGSLIWYISSRLSADAIGLAIGVMLGVLAGLPAALLVMASGRRGSDRDAAPTGRQHPYSLPGHAAPNAPVIVLAGNGFPHGQPMAGQPTAGHGSQQQLALPGPEEPSQERRFKVVGEREEWVDEW